uniref:Uncharacterized protein n=1 Tax=Rhizophora mucronata TaxID=61149 RepID=A0A2P2N7I1_RHIMU
MIGDELKSYACVGLDIFNVDLQML